MLGRRVRRITNLAQKPGCRRNIDEMPFAALEHVRDDSTSCEHMSHDIHAPTRVPAIVNRVQAAFSRDCTGCTVTECDPGIRNKHIYRPEIPFDLDLVAEKVLDRQRHGRDFSIIVVAEGAVPKDGERSILGKALGQAERLGGIGLQVTAGLEEITGKETRTVVLGHLLRGGGPTTTDRLLALRFGSAAIRSIASGCFGCMVALDPPVVRNVPLSSAISRMKTVPLDSDIMLTARDLGISFGD